MSWKLAARVIVEHALELLADDRPVLLDVRTQGKRSSGKKVASPTSERRPMKRSIGREDPFACGDRPLHDALPQRLLRHTPPRADP
jgi:hypothetical protein